MGGIEAVAKEEKDKRVPANDNNEVASTTEASPLATATFITSLGGAVEDVALARSTQGATEKGGLGERQKRTNDAEILLYSTARTLAENMTNADLLLVVRELSARKEQYAMTHQQDDSFEGNAEDSLDHQRELALSATLHTLKSVERERRTKAA